MTGKSESIMIIRETAYMDRKKCVENQRNNKTTVDTKKETNKKTKKEKRQNKKEIKAEKPLNIRSNPET